VSLEEQLKARIAAEGPIGVDEYMAAANAHYYAKRDPLGADGDFITAPEIHQMFGELVGAALADVWVRAGQPADAVYAELGPGRGTLAEDALRVLRRAGFDGEVHLVETSPSLREVQASRLPEAEFHESLRTIALNRPLLMVANEVFDALPIRQWVGERERRIAIEDDGFAFTVDGEIREDSPDRTALALEMAGQLGVRGGAAIIIDYGHSAGEQGDTLQSVRAHRFADPLKAPGEQDLTAHVDFAALAEAARIGDIQVSGVVSQGTWLETLGIGARAMALAAKNPQDTERIAAARRRLCDEGEMGRLFKVMALTGKGWPSVAGLGA
jgi:NADH dehydrogenase [ubiquinone] 1 alpha subcomplex assembly factor 7